jgi:hypothetical protein
MFKYPNDLVVCLLDPFFANEWLKLVLKCCLLSSQELDSQRINIRNPWIVCMWSQFLAPWRRNLKNVLLKFWMSSNCFQSLCMSFLCYWCWIKPSCNESWSRELTQNTNQHLINNNICKKKTTNNIQSFLNI